MLTLLNKTAELALDLLEKNGVLFPFCKASTVSNKPLVIMANSNDDGRECSVNDLRRSTDSIWIDLKRRIASGEISEFAFRSDNVVKFQGEPEHRRFLKIEFQNGTEETGVYFFPLSVENGNAQVTSKYLSGDVPEKLL